jgi:hypothetical protein
VSRAAVWTGVTASQALFSLTVRHTPARTGRVDADGAQARREGGARRRAEAAERASGSGSAGVRTVSMEPARGVDTHGRRGGRADTAREECGHRGGGRARAVSRAGAERRPPLASPL